MVACGGVGGVQGLAQRRLSRLESVQSAAAGGNHWQQDHKGEPDSKIDYRGPSSRHHMSHAGVSRPVLSCAVMWCALSCLVLCGALLCGVAACAVCHAACSDLKVSLQVTRAAMLLAKPICNCNTNLHTCAVLCCAVLCCASAQEQRLRRLPRYWLAPLQQQQPHMLHFVVP